MKVYFCRRKIIRKVILDLKLADRGTIKKYTIGEIKLCRSDQNFLQKRSWWSGDAAFYAK